MPYTNKTRIKVSENFFLDEFVDPVTYDKENDCGLSKVDPKVIKLAQLLRTKYGKSITINNWWSAFVKFAEKNPEKTAEDFSKAWSKKGNFQWSAYRSDRCKIGSKASAHKLGKGIDPKGDEKALYKIVTDNLKEFYDLGLRRLEDIKITKGWLHMDTHEHNTIGGYVNVVDLKSVVERLKVN